MARIHRAARIGALSEVAEEIRGGADVNARSIRGDTPLMLAVQEDYPAVVRLLLDAGADPNAARRNGETALHLAASTDAVETVRLLLDRGADLNLVTMSGATPAINAAMGRRQEMMELLLSRGADGGVRCRRGMTAADWLAAGGLSGHMRRTFGGTPAPDGGPPFARERDEAKIRGLMTETPSPEEWVAEHGRNTLVWSYGVFRYQDPAAQAWAHRVWELLRDPALLAECEERFLKGERLEQARGQRAHAAKRNRRDARRRQRAAESAGEEDSG